MYTQRAHHDTQNQGSPFPQGPAPGLQNENISMNTMLNQFANANLDGGNMASTGVTMANQLPVGANPQLYITADGQLFCAPGIYSTRPLASNQLTHSSYNAYTTSLPCLAQSAYPSYLPGYASMMPYPAARGYYRDRDQLHKEVPGLENRRGSYSTNESAPSTSYYDHGTHIAPVDRSLFGYTPSPQDLQIQHIPQPSKVPFKTIPVDVDVNTLLLQHPAIPPAVPAVFTPRESMRTLDQSLSNPIQGNRNVYIRGLHPNTDNETLAAYAARFGMVETSKAIIDTSTGACKG
jgi:hypothetical protein